MQYLTLDSIVRNVLLKEAKPIHGYLQYLAYACAALQKLNTTTLRAVNSVKLPVTDYKSIELPIDYIDWLVVGYQVGERVRPMIHDERLNRLNNFDNLGSKIVYAPTLPDGTSIGETASSMDLAGVPFDYYSNGYNYGTGYPGYITNDIWKFRELKERNEIQLSAAYPYDFVILDYLTDGRTLDNATKINPLAIEAIEKFIRWQYTLHSRSYSPGERQEAERIFYAEWRFLRASMNTLSKDQIVHALKSHYLPYYQAQNSGGAASKTLPQTAPLAGTFVTEDGVTFISEDGTESFKTE